MIWLRVFFSGGVTSYRALFAWINPWMAVPMLVLYPIFQILFFVYLGRSAGVASDSFFLIGNTFIATAVTGLFGMGQAIAGERRFQTLPILLASPASRLALFLGRAVPSIVNGFVVAAISFALGAWIVGIRYPGRTLEELAVVLLVSCFACTALGLAIGSLGIRGRSVSLFADSISGSMLIVSGANVPFARLPHVLRTISSGIPLTHGIVAARELTAGASLGHVEPLLGKELLIGVIYLVVGLAMLSLFEHEGRRTGALDRF
ncbi:MAG TPA: ABC transporter permease [Gaiellaceae bacterium]|nr:ABC transporter permease [Gaiellaceae bacterium]